MDTAVTIIMIIAIVCTCGIFWLFFAFVKRKNRPKVSRTEDEKEEMEKPKSGELEDPLN